MFNPVEDYQNTIISKTHLPLLDSSVVLDLGCGRGDNSIIFAKKALEVIGVDIKDTFLGDATRNVSFQIANAENLPFSDDTFDVIFSKDTFHHLKNIGNSLKEAFRVLKPGGSLVIVESNRLNPIFYVHMTLLKGHNHFSKSYFALLLRDNGIKSFEVRKVHSRVYPVPSAFLHKVFHLYEYLFERFPLINNFCTYNIFYIKNEK